MEKSISDYDQSLVELEKQREQLELVMKKMGQEWEERYNNLTIPTSVEYVCGFNWPNYCSGAGIGWMNTLDLAGAATGSDSSPSTIATPNDPSQLQHEPSLADPYPTPLSPDSNMVSSPVATKARHPPLLDDLLTQPATGPSPEYLQSLLHVNEALLAQSLSTTSTAYPPSSPSAVDATFVSPPTTPEDQAATQKDLGSSTTTRDPAAESNTPTIRENLQQQQ